MGGTRFRLRNLSMVSIAAMLWDSQDIKNQIKNNFSGLVWGYADKNWCQISKLVVQNANSINLPLNLSVLLQKTVLFIGQKIYEWIHYVTQILGLDLIFTQKIYFSFGAVDEIKIFDLYWRDLMASDNVINQSNYFRHSPLFSLACMLGCERFVKERKNEMLDELIKFWPEIKAGDEIYNIMSVSICLTANKSILENVASPQRMFELCLEKSFSKAAKFYWEKLDEVEKDSNLTNFAKKCFLNDYSQSFLMEKHCENLLFLINQMEEKERSLFFRDYADEIIRLFLLVWPHQKLILKYDLLKYDWNINSSKLLKMADFLISFSERMNRLEFPLNNELIFQIMQKGWGGIPVDEKVRFLRGDPLLISRLFLTFNPDILNLVFNDPSIREVIGKEVDSFIKEGFGELVKVGKFNFLNTLMKTVFNFIPEPKESLKEKFSNLSFVLQLINKDESFALVDRFLNRSAESEVERAILKNEINTIAFCIFLTSPPYEYFKFELAEKFLKWKLETDAKIKSFKEEMKSYNFVIVYCLTYVRIKSGDLSWLRPGDELATHLDENPFGNVDGLAFLKFEDATELNRGVALGLKSFRPGIDYKFLGPNCRNAMTFCVEFVGTKVGDFIVFTVRSIWNNKRDSAFNLDKIVNLSNAFIKFYYETDEEVLEFKKTKLLVLVTENVVEFLLDAFRSRMHVPEHFLDDFCEFCTIPSEEIEEIKIRQRSDIEEFLDTYLIHQLNFELADYYLNWLFREAEKMEVCKKFLNSSNKGALMCVSYLKKWGNYDSEICRWLSLVDDKEKLKNDVFALYENTPEWFPALLDKSAHT